MRKIALLIASGIAALFCSEVFARRFLGLGTPPLSIPHPQIEYMFKPDQSVLRFGNRIEFNHYGMRSEPFAPKPVVGECRIIVFGDSVLNGGSLSDQNAIATEIWRAELSGTHSGTIVVGNVSAGSWGPGNWLGYARTYGFFGADTVILLISTHDIFDNPDFGILDPMTHPQAKPALALGEAIFRYLPKYVWPSDPAIPDTKPLPAPDRGAVDTRTFLKEAKSAVPQVVVVQFLDRAELGDGPGVGYWLIREIAIEEDVDLYSSEALFKEAMATTGQQFRDSIHPNDAGQATLARLFNTIENPCDE